MEDNLAIEKRLRKSTIRKRNCCVGVSANFEKMILVGHEAVSVTDPVVTLVDMLEGIQEVSAAGVIF